LTFFPRAASSYNWEEPSFAKEDIPVPMEFTLYTPPVTPGSELTKELTEITSAEYSSCPTMEDKIETVPECEFITSTKESTDFNKSSLFESLELVDVNSKENKNMNKQIVDVRTLPKIVNIKKTNINLKIFSNINNNCDNRKLQERNYSFMNTNVVDTFKNLDISNKCTEFGLSQQYNTTNEQNENGKLQLDATVNEVKTDIGTETLSKAKNTLIDLDTTINLDTTNQSTESISNNDIDTLLEDILNNENNLPIALNDDWLNMLVS